MFYNETVAMNQVEEDPSLIFALIDEGHMELVDKLLNKKIVSVNEIDEYGNTVIMKLLKKGAYNLVLRHMQNHEFDINHQNIDGDTFAHILVGMNYKKVAEIMKKLQRNKKYLPNIKNNKGETVLDKSINENYIYTAMKVLEDERFTNIDVVSFKNLYDAYIKNKEYGKYAKVMNLEMILKNLDKKCLRPSMDFLISTIKNNYDAIKRSLIDNNLKLMDEIIDTCVVKA